MGYTIARRSLRSSPPTAGSGIFTTEAKPDISVVIPAYNEEKAVGPLVREIKRLLVPKTKAIEILVVDDGSTDSTADAAEAAGACLLRHPANRGYGRALMTGVAAARHEWIVMIDADGSYPASEIEKLLDFVPDFDLVIGSRSGFYFWGSPFQAWLRWMYLSIAEFVVGEKIPDANSGLRAVRKSFIASQGPIVCHGYSHSTTMTLSFLKAGRFVKFVPIAFTARTGRSKVKLARDILRTLQIMLEVILVYNPLKLFVGLAILFLAAGGAGWILAPGREAFFLAASGFFSALACFLTGCLLDTLRLLMPGRGQT